jgi:hypothetical protein
MVACGMDEKSFISLVDNTVREIYNDSDEIPEEDEIRERYEAVFDALFVALGSNVGRTKDEIIDELVDGYCTDLTVKKKLGFEFKDDESAPWLNAAEENIEWFYWKRYKNYLIRDKKWAPAAVKSIDRDGRNILDLMANPNVEGAFERRGLVVASVQSGKTANYIGLICRAADVGYKIIIVMAGVHNVLRNQTQARLEDGFTGFNIANGAVEPVGVGNDKNKRRPIACTSREADFNTKRADALRGLQTTQTNEPLLFVIKKNSSSLKQVYEWLKTNAKQDEPLLLIDDEADNASINGKYKMGTREDETTKINGQIRQLFNHFSRACYVGYTATPFANVLIDPTVDTDDFGKDLFPSNFIYTLEESSDYFGARKVFGDYDEPSPKHLRFIEDNEGILPIKHKSDFEPFMLPLSLKRAMRTFYLATAIRELRPGPHFHSTMMINISPYKKPQGIIRNFVEEYLEELNNAAKVYGCLKPKAALGASKDLRDLHQTWEEEYKGLGFEWAEIQKALYNPRYHVVAINSSSGDALDYANQDERVIAVGGYRLSRGLTLEGLTVSYYSRNARAYDALMQMARWFGYRPGYEDLCRVWMTDQAAGWYSFVADSTENLFDQLRSMRQAQRTPRNYVLKIRQSPDALTVTARNKMGAAEETTATVDLNEGFIETASFMRDVDVAESNKAAMEKLLTDISEQAAFDEDGPYKYLFKNVPVEHVKAFLEAYENENDCSPKSQSNPVISYIDGRLIDGELENWDVLVAHGASKNPTIALPAVGDVNLEQRYPGSNTNHDRLVVGEKRRLSSRGVEAAGLTLDEIDEARELYEREHGVDGASNCSDIYFRRLRMKPLLVLHPVLVKYRDSQVEKAQEENKKLMDSWPDWTHEERAFGWSISFPRSDKGSVPVTYMLNARAMENIMPEKEDSDDDFEDDEQ